MPGGENLLGGRLNCQKLFLGSSKSSAWSRIAVEPVREPPVSPSFGGRARKDRSADLFCRSAVLPLNLKFFRNDKKNRGPTEQVALHLLSMATAPLG